MLALDELRDGAEIAATVAAAAETGIFNGLAAGPASSDALANTLGLDPRATRIVLAMLQDLGLLKKHGGKYSPTEECRRQLIDTKSPEYAAGGLPLWLENLRGWTHLPDVLRSGKRTNIESQGTSTNDLAHFLAGMAAAPAERVRRLVAACLARRPASRTIIDLGGGPGHIASEFVRAGLEATMVETPETAEYVAGAYGLGEVSNLHLVAADFMEQPLPPGPFDIALLSNITHMYTREQNRALLKKVHHVLTPGGLVAIGDFVRGRSPRAARFAIVMLLRTEEGDTYTEEEYQQWLDDAGFDDVVVDDIDVDRQLISALKAG